MGGTSEATPYDREFFESLASGSLASARIVLGEVFAPMRIRSVVDIGCGLGGWLCAARELGATRCLGIDGDHVDRTRLLIAPSDFRAHDLEKAGLAGVLGEGESFDLALSMEVAEHLPPGRAASFIGDLCGLSNLVLFSAAIPGQGGTHHVNEQWPDYWAALFDRQDFDCFDVLRQRLWNEEGCEYWYAQNAMLFARRGSLAAQRASLLGPPTRAPLPLVHPRRFKEVLAEAERASKAAAWFQAENARILASRSWRATAPLRWLTGRFRR
ncbi:MAG: class I SAM-dependent methyltransferase [Acetobacteraceae bacterium]|nr:class I SAM-dependent methyltransferase [Acetobacteraceae bacterium]